MAAGRCDRIAQHIVDAEPVCTCITLCYFMDKKHTGTLSLMNDTRSESRGPIHKCHWRSERTKLSTDWHGNWWKTANGYMCHFDCFGIQGDGSKWSMILPGGVGRDYAGRDIIVAVTRAYVVDPPPMAFVLDKDEHEASL